MKIMLSQSGINIDQTIYANDVVRKFERYLTSNFNKTYCADANLEKQVQVKVFGKIDKIIQTEIKTTCRRNKYLQTETS